MLPDLTEWGSGLKPRIFPQMLLNIGHYRPQRSCGKVIQYFTGICQSFCSQRGEGGVWQTPQGRHPQEDTLPGQTPPCPVHTGIHTLCSVHARIHTPQTDNPPMLRACWDTHPPSSHCSGRYASYWNAFLFQYKFIMGPKAGKAKLPLWCMTWRLTMKWMYFRTTYKTKYKVLTPS